MKTRACKVCGVEINSSGKGTPRTLCSKECRVLSEKNHAKERQKNLPECKEIGCTNKANRKGAGLCEACYMRLRRKGTTDYKSLPYRLNHPAGYVWLREPDHPLSDSRGLVYEHRYVFYEANGSGPFKCYWCGIEIKWDCMDVDHLDDNKANNDISNLVASCHKCNSRRGTWKMVRARREQWTQITYKGTTKTGSEWARELGLSRSGFMWRIERWPIDVVMSTPHGKTGPK